MNFFQRFWHRRYLRFKKNELRKYQAYHKTFDHLYFVEKNSFRDLEDTFYRIIRFKNLLKRLPQPIAEYRNLSKLNNDIYEYIAKYQQTRDAVNSKNFPKAFRKIVKRNIEQFVKIYHENRYLIDHDIKAFKKYEYFLKFLNKKGLNLADERDELLNNKVKEIEKVENCRVLLKDYQKKKLIVEVDDFDAMQTIGPKAWCITTEYSSWKEYVGKKKQVIIWNFSILDTHPKHCIGITFNEKKEQIVHAFNGENDKIKTGKTYKYIQEAYGTKVHNQ